MSSPGFLSPLLRKDAQGKVAAGIFVLATLIRLYFNLSAHPLRDHLRSDMWVYDFRAGHLLDRAANEWDTFTPVGYPAFLALVWKLVGSRNYEVIGVLQALMGGATCAVAHLLARRVSGSSKVAVICSVLLTFYLPFILYGGYLLTEGPSALLVTLLAFLILRAHDHPTPLRFAVAGLVMGMATTIRPNVLLFYPLLVLYAWAAQGRSLRKGAIFAGKLIAWSMPLLLAASIHNSRILGRPAGLGTNGGLNFYLAHAEVQGVTFREGSFLHHIVPIPNLVRYKDTFDSPVPLYDEGFFYKKGIALFREDPFRILTSLDNLVEGTGLGKQDFWPGWGTHERLLLFVSKAMFCLGIVPMALHALVLLGLRRLTFPRETPRLLLFCFVLSSMVTLYGFLGDPRVRVPFDALIVILSVDGWVRGLRGLSVLREELPWGAPRASRGRRPPRPAARPARGKTKPAPVEDDLAEA